MSLTEFKKLSIKKKIYKIIFIIQKIQFLLKNILKNNNIKLEKQLIDIFKEFEKLNYYLDILSVQHPKFNNEIAYFKNTIIFKDLQNFSKIKIDKLTEFKKENLNKNIIKNLNKFNKENLNKLKKKNFNKFIIYKQDNLEISNQKNNFIYNENKISLYIEETQKFIYKIKDKAQINDIKNDFDRINKNINKIVNPDNSSFAHLNEVLLADIRSPFNIGSIIRSAESFGFKKIWLYGISSSIERKKIFKTSKLAENFIEIEDIDFLKLKRLKGQNYWESIIGLETVDESIGILNINKKIIRKKSLIVLGNEEFGIPENIIPLIDVFINIPMVGSKNSINVANAFSIIAYKILEIYIKK